MPSQQRIRTLGEDPKSENAVLKEKQSVQSSSISGVTKARRNNGPLASLKDNATLPLEVEASGMDLDEQVGVMISVDSIMLAELILRSWRID